jgi:hypothetical protein
MNEVIVDKWKEVYSIKVPQIKGFWNRLILFSICFSFPSLYYYRLGLRERNVIKLLNTNTGKTRIIKEELNKTAQEIKA